ncbi:unnamed protein product [Camellia sinensis]
MIACGRRLRTSKQSSHSCEDATGALSPRQTSDLIFERIESMVEKVLGTALGDSLVLRREWVEGSIMNQWGASIQSTLMIHFFQLIMWAGIASEYTNVSSSAILSIEILPFLGFHFPRYVFPTSIIIIIITHVVPLLVTSIESFTFSKKYQLHCGQNPKVSRTKV